MQEKMEGRHRFGLIGKNISYSFSRGYFSEKFKELNLSNHTYENFDIQSIDELTKVLKESNLKGLNVTIPYKQAVFDFLDEVDKEALEIGAVNTIKITKDKKLIGFNTDVYGFKQSIQPFLKEHHKNALVLGTGGASKAVEHVFKKMGIEVSFVSRNPKNEHAISYKELTKKVLKTNRIIVNCSPVGTYPDVDECPDIPYKHLTSKHLLYDLIYNPPQTLFLIKGLEEKAAICNGLRMLQLQAEKAWEIWNS